jgi:uncharacterized protein YeaO (DUF488 family)
MINIKRIYDARADDDGLRVLVERLWPRGVSKADAGVDIWLRDVAPSTELRKWYDHQPDRWPAFQKRYRAELALQVGLPALLKHVTTTTTVTLIYAAADTERNGAIVLREFLQSASKPT